MKPWTYQKNSDTIGILTDYFIQQEEFMYKAIFFDLDGTLTESGEGITKSVQYALEKLGVSAPELEPLKVFVGPPLLEQFMKYAGFDKETAQKGIEYYRERYSEKGMYENTVYPGVEKHSGRTETSWLQTGCGVCETDLLRNTDHGPF